MHKNRLDSIEHFETHHWLPDSNSTHYLFGILTRPFKASMGSFHRGTLSICSLAGMLVSILTTLLAMNSFKTNSVLARELCPRTPQMIGFLNLRKILLSVSGRLWIPRTLRTNALLLAIIVLFNGNTRPLGQMLTAVFLDHYHYFHCAEQANAYPCCSVKRPCGCAIERIHFCAYVWFDIGRWNAFKSRA